MNPFRQLAWRLWPVLCLTIIGCESGPFPNAPDLSPTPKNNIQTASPQTSIRFALAPPALGKPAGEQTSSDIKTRRIGQDGGQITIFHEQTRATFRVPEDALDEPTIISMQTHGSGPATQVEFGPDGLHFKRTCLLGITFSSEGVDPNTLGGYLLNEDGTTTPVRYKIIVREKTITILIAVKHFSTYSGGDGENDGVPEEDLDTMYDEWEENP